MLINLFHRIFDRKESLSREDIETYLSGDADERTKRLIEQKLAASEFDEEAMEGFEKHDLSIHAMKKLDKRFYGTNSTVLWIGLAVAAVILLVALLIPREIDQEYELLALNKEVTSVNNEPLGKHEEPELNSSNQTDTATGHGSTPLTKEETDPTFTRKLASPAQKPAERQSYSLDETNRYSEKQSAPILPPNMKSIQLNDEIQASYEVERLTGKEIYLYEFKFIDYRGNRFMPADASKELRGTSAELEKKSKSERAVIEDESPSTNTIPYHDFLTETARLMKSADFATALVNYKRILIAYPTDDNALFYAGFCLFQLGNYKQAMVYFNQSESSVRINFHEEAEWYIFKCYLRLNDSEKAKKQGLKVIARNGYYKKEAENLVKQLN